jgi:dihydrofolate reductase
MRRIRYSVATSLDGFIAGPNGQFNWIVMDPGFDFEAFYQEFDAVLMGRRAFETAGGGAWQGMKTFVVSRTLRQDDHPDVTVIGDNLKQTLTALRRQPGKDIWLFGGGLLFRSLLDLDLVDAIEVAVVPALLGDGIPILPPPFTPTKLELANQTLYKSGIVGLEYILRPRPAARANRDPKRSTGRKGKKAERSTSRGRTTR